jgi:hypothetical protein
MIDGGSGQWPGPAWIGQRIPANGFIGVQNRPALFLQPKTADQRRQLTGDVVEE